MAKAAAPAKPNDRIVALGRNLFALKARKDAIEEDLSQVNEAIKQLATVDLAKLMEDSGVEKLTIADAGTVYLSQDFFASVNKDDRPKLYTWMREQGHGDIIQDWVFPQTLTAFCKEMVGKNLPLPDVVKAFYQPTAKTRKA